MRRLAAPVFFFVFSCLALIQAARAEWTDLGVHGGRVFDMAADPLVPSRIFAATYLGGGLFVSQDGGASWQVLRMDHLIEGEDTFEGQAVYAVEVAPGDSDVVWATHNYWAARSDDGGRTWRHIYNRAMQADCRNCAGTQDSYRLCRALAIDPFDPAVVYVGTGGPMGADHSGAVYKTEDGGVTWTKLNYGNDPGNPADLDYRVEAVAVDPHHANIVWAVTNANGHDGMWDGTVYRSTDSGRTFEPITPKPTTGIVTSVAPKPDDPDVVFVTGTYGVIRLEFVPGEDPDPGQWNASYPIPGCWYGTDVAFSPTNPDTLYAVWYLSPGWGPDPGPKVSRSTDGGLTWETVTVGADVAYYFNTVAIDPFDPQQVYVGDDTLGVLRSLDQGRSWAPINQGLAAVLVYDLDVDAADTTHMIAASGSGLYERPAGSTVWQRMHNGDFRSARFAPGSGTTYYAGAYGALVRTSDAGASWQYTAGLPGVVSDIAVDADHGATVFVTSGRQLLRSLDGGLTFETILDGINQDGEHYSMNTVVIDPSDSRRLLAGGGDWYSPGTLGDLWESTDGGTAWRRTGLTRVIVNAVLIDPRNPQTMYAGCGYSHNYTPPLYKSVDGGASWSEAARGLPNLKIDINGIWAAGPSDLFAVGESGTVFRYEGAAVASLPSATPSELLDIFGLAPDAVWAVGADGVVIGYDGHAWTLQESGVDVTLRGVWAAAADSVFVVGDGGTIRHSDGNRWTPMAAGLSEPKDLYAVFGIPGGPVVAVGQSGTIVHRDPGGDDWSAWASPTDRNLYAVWGLSGDDFYAVGDQGTIVHFDGTRWALVYSGSEEDCFRGIWGSGPDDLYVAAGWRGRILHYDGAEWQATYLPSGLSTVAIDGAAGNAVFAAEDDGGLSMYDGTRWSSLRTPGSPYRSVTDLAFHRSNPDIVYAATTRAGVYISPDQAGHWLGLGRPPSQVYAISSGSLYAGTGRGVFQLTGTGVVAGRVRDINDARPIDGAAVGTQLGMRCRTIAGNYMMVVPAGIFDLYALADNYQMGTATGLTVYGSDVTWWDFDMTPAAAFQPGDYPDNGSTYSESTSGGAYCFIGTLTLAAKHRLAYGRRLAWALLWLAGAALARRLGVIFFCVMAAAPVLLLLAQGANADTIFQQVQITSPPVPVGSGARALGMGGAFIAIADDATAASWNPAGLIQLERPEISVVGAYTHGRTHIESGTHPESDTRSSDSLAALNYLSAAVPVRWFANMVFALTYQRLYEFECDFGYRIDYERAGLNLSESNAFSQSGYLGAVGLAGSIELTPRLSLGLTLNVWTDQLGWDNGWSARYTSNAAGSEAGVPVTITTAISEQYEKFRGINFNLGILWDIGPWGHFGAVVKTPFTASLVHRYCLFQASTYGPPLNDTSETGPIRIDEAVDVDMPLSYGLGWSRRFSDRFTMALDVSRTHWDDYTLTDSQGNAFSPIDGRPKAQSRVDPTTQVRMGGEYVFALAGRRTAMSLRAGLFYDPEPGHGGQRDYYGVTVGGGFTERRFSLDLAYYLRWGHGVDAGHLIAGGAADVVQQSLLASLICYF